jgi:photosystem II stability/assembly factor-like uncharacterized protein
MPRRRVAAFAVIAVVVALATTIATPSTPAAPAAPAASATKTPFSIDAEYEAKVENDYTTQFPSRWTNQQRGTAWRTAHDAAALFIRDEWTRLLKPFQAEGAFAELRPFNFVNPTGTQPDNQDPIAGLGPENNVLAFMPGADPALRNQVVVIGGHYDCVDITVDGGLDCGMQIPATTAVLEGLVRYWRANGIRPRRSVAMFAIDGEEQCLCGSVHYTTVGSVNALAHHLELPPAMSVVAYHDTDMIGANYPNRLFGRSGNDFMPMNVFSAPALEDPARVLAPFPAYQAAVANPAFLARYKLYRQAMKAQRDRLFADFHAKYPTWTYADGVTKPLFTAEQKKYVNIVDDPLDRSDHTVFISQGVPADINIGLSDPTAAPPGWVPYHHVGESQEDVEYARSGRMTLNADVLLGYEVTAAWVAYMSGAGEDSDPTMPFFMGEAAPSGLAPIAGVKLDGDTAVLPDMPASQVGGSWQPIGPARTIVRGLTVDPADPNRLYLASQDRGFVVSRDGGKTFVESNAGLDGFTSLWAVTAEAAAPGRLYASTHHGGVYRSDDGGATWRHTHAAVASTPADVTYAAPADPVDGTQLLIPNIEVSQDHAKPGGMWLYGYDQCLAQHAPPGQACATRADWPPEGYDAHAMVLDHYRYASDAVLAADGALVASGFSTYLTDGGTFRSENGGGTWTYTWPAMEDSNVWRLARGGPTLYASGTGGVFRSDDNGRTWAKTAAATSEVRALAVDPAHPDVVYAGSWNAAGGVFKTTDGGKTWATASGGLPARAGIAALAVDPTDPQHVAAATYWYGVYLSADGGRTWAVAASGMPVQARQRLDDVDFGPDGTLYASSHHGVFVLGAAASRVGSGTDGAVGSGPGRLPATGGSGVPWPGALAAAVAAAIGLAGLAGLRSRRLRGVRS